MKQIAQELVKVAKLLIAAKPFLQAAQILDGKLHVSIYYEIKVMASITKLTKMLKVINDSFKKLGSTFGIKFKLPKDGNVSMWMGSKMLFGASTIARPKTEDELWSALEGLKAMGFRIDQLQ